MFVCPIFKRGCFLTTNILSFFSLGASSESPKDNDSDTCLPSSPSAHPQDNSGSFLNKNHHDRCQLLGKWSTYKTILDDVKEAVSLVVTLQKRVAASREFLKQV